MTRRPREPLRDARGYTLAELAVTLAIFALIMLGLISTWSKAQESYFIGSETAEVQQNVRAAIDFMVREIRAAGRDMSNCAFDYATSSPILTGADCDATKATDCQTKMGGSYTATGCQSIFAMPFGTWGSAPVGISPAPDIAPGCPGTVPSVCALVVRADRNDNGTVFGTANASGSDDGGESVLYAIETGSVCPGGGACITRRQGGQASGQGMVAVDIDTTQTRFTYFPLPGYPGCTGSPLPARCDTPYADPGPASQAEADGISRIQIQVRALQTFAGEAIARTMVTDVYLRNRN
jgi:prepilin-type N-terminal cleavage/methylation domain-containing protein